jgi:hypothetical protein
MTHNGETAAQPRLSALIRKLLLIVLGSLTVAILATAVIAWSAIKRLGPEEIGKRIRTAVKAETGLDLVSGRLTTRVSYHVIITLDSVRLLDGNQTVAHFDRIRLTCGYRTLIFHRGLPFLLVSMARPKVVLPVRSVTPGPMPILDADSVRDLRRILVRLSNVTRKIVMSTAKVEDRDGQVLFEDAAVTASHRGAAAAWRVRVMGLFRGIALPNFQLGASVVVAPEMDGPDVPFARGSLWFWNVHLRDLATTNFKLNGDLQGNLTFLIRTDGTVRGQALTRTTGLQVSGPLLVRSVQVPELTVAARLIHSVSGSEITQFAMRSQGRELLSGAATLMPLPPDNLRINVRFLPLSLGPDQLRSALAPLRVTPGWLAAYAQTVSAGRVSLDRATLDTTLKELEAPSANLLLRHVALKATLDGLAVNLPQIPPIAEMDGKLDYAGGVVRLTQGHTSFGASTLNQVSLSADLNHAPARLPYTIKIAGEAEAGEILEAVRRTLTKAEAEHLAHIYRLQGRAAVAAEARGELTDLTQTKTPEYRAVLRPNQISLGLAEAPSEFRLYGGKITVSPGEILVDRLELAPRQGSMIASGRIQRLRPGVYELVKLDLEMHQIDAHEWLPRLIAIDTMDVHAPASGALSIERIEDGAESEYRVDGNLGLGPGEVKFAFLRSPVVLAQPATVMLKGEGGSLAMTGASFEGAPLDMTVAVDDVRKPRIRIDAHAQRLDLESIAAVRLPWTPKALVKIDNTPFEGHVEADQASLSELQMTSLKASFRRDADNWRVFDINADAMGGHLTMDLTGRRRDDWVHIISSAHDIDAAALQALGGGQTVITGRLSSAADLWADTNSDFFNTLTGSLSATVKNGVLLKFKLLSRMLSLVDISEWLNANIPDPRVKGVPFRTMTARFFGEQGKFETTDFMLDGPVMKITAAGKIDLAQSGMNMMIGMRPFQLLDTVFNKIPLIGPRLAQSQSGIVAAYFHVQGPISDPTVMPAPITSISHLLIKTLAIPINLLVPETVK